MKLKLIVLGLFLSISAYCQFPTMLPTEQVEEKSPISISKIHTEVSITGNVATTTFDILFHNASSRVLTGDLTLPLGEGQEICRYALEVNGGLREGVVVEKVKARQTFEAVVSRKIDPGIGSITKGNTFQTKVYPLMPQQTKRVVLAFSETLSGDSDNLVYNLPFSDKGTIAEFSLNVNVYKGNSSSQSPLPASGKMKFDTQDDVYNLKFNRTDYAPKEPISFTVPRFSKNGQQMFTCEFDGQTYFYLYAKAPDLQSKRKDSPSNIAIYWDNSFSGRTRNIADELTLLSQYLQSIPGRKTVSVVSFHLQQAEPKSFTINTNAKDLIEYLRGLTYDGATNLNALDIKGNYDEVLFFSDAVPTIGTDSIAYSARCPIYTISSSSGANYSTLRKLARNTNAEFINLQKLTPEQALKTLQVDEEKLLQCTYSATDLADVYPSHPVRVGEYVQLCGILKKETAQVELQYGFKKQATQTQNFTISKSTNAPIQRIWAQQKIEDLTVEYDKNKYEILRLGQKFNIITQNASFLVLDRIEDYVQHEIVPPVEMQAEYYKRIAQKPKVQDVNPETQIADIIGRVDRLNRWYNPGQYPQANVQKSSIEPVEMNIVDDAIEIEEEEAEEPRRNQVNEVVRLGYMVQKREDATGAVLSERPEAPTLGDDPALQGSAPGVRVTSNSGAPGSGVQVQIRGMTTLPSSGTNQQMQSPAVSNPTIQVLAWQPDAPYLDSLSNASAEQFDAVYERVKQNNVNRPAFYLEVADMLFTQQKHDKAVRILSNTVELDLENFELLRTIGWKFMHEGESKYAIELFTEVKNLRPEEPNSYRDLALAYTADKQYQKALDMYVYILSKSWQRYDDIKDVVLNELNNLISLHRSAVDVSRVNKNYLFEMALDVRITISWTSNNNDIDLWVIDPNGEKCYYQNKRTAIGGKMSTDFTNGYGPEEFSLKTVTRGYYTVFVNYFGESRQTITGPVTLYATLTTNYGRPNEKSEYISVQLKDNKETKQIAQLKFE